MQFFKKILHNWPLLFLVFIAIVISFLNYEPNTWLIGWDNLQLELNPLLNLNRALNTTWQEYQGFGLLGGMGHGAALIPSLLALLYTQFFSPQFFRYLTTFTALVLGPLGTYLLAKNTLLNTHKIGKGDKNLAGFFAGLFYLLNLGTLQVFYIPFETFTWFYLSLPWLLYASIKYLDHPTKRTLLFIILIHLFAAPAFYVQTMFVVYLLCLLPIILYFLISRHFFKAFTSSFFLGLTLFLTQAYWLLPSLYFTLTSSSTTINALQNQISTPEIALRNQEYGDLKNVTLLKGFNFDYADLAPDGDFKIMMGPWVDHLNNQTIQIIGYFFFILILIGLFYSFKRRLRLALPLTIIFLLSLFFLIGNNPPSGPFFSLLGDTVPLLNQFFRSVFTKWSIPAALSFSLFFSVGVVFLLDIFSFLHFNLTTYLTSFSLGLLLLLFISPMFQGHLIYPAMRQNLPSEYQQLFAFFNEADKNTRILNLPGHSIWGWQFTDWGYRGSGFLWYGIKQPIMDRAFDVWTPYGDTYYQELQTAIYSKDLTQLENLLEKYQISWILLDRSVIVPGSDYQTALYLPEIQELLSSSNNIVSTKDFGFLSVYEVKLDTKPAAFFNTTPFTPQEVTFPRSTLALSRFEFMATPDDNRSTVSDQASNCDAFNDDQYNREVIDNTVVYTARNANSCDHFTFPELPHALGYKVSFEHQNLEGLPFLVCLESYASRNCLIYKYLTKSSSWHTDDLILPPMNAQDYGYTIHLYNYSIGQTKTANAWRSLKVTPINPQSFDLTPKTHDNPYTQVSNPTKRTYSLYTVSANSNTTDSIIILNQGFDPGWKAYFVSKNHLNLPTPLLYLYSSLLVPLPEAHHFKANGWANGWLLPQGESNLLIVYQPQLLQYLGFFALILIPFVIVIFPIKPPRHS